jgi:hypothetical protein
VCTTNDFKNKEANRKLKQQKKIFHANTNKIKCHYINSKVGNQSKTITGRDKDHFVMIKWSVHPEVTTTLNVHPLNNRASRYMQQKLIEL